MEPRLSLLWAQERAIQMPAPLGANTPLHVPRLLSTTKLSLTSLPPPQPTRPHACRALMLREGPWPLMPQQALSGSSHERQKRVGGWCSGWWQKAPHMWTPLFISLHSSTSSILLLEYSRSRVISYLFYIPTWHTLPMRVPCASPLPTEFPPTLTDSGDKSDFLICIGNLETYANHCKFLFTDWAALTNRSILTTELYFKCNIKFQMWFLEKPGNPG